MTMRRSKPSKGKAKCSSSKKKKRKKRDRSGWHQLDLFIEITHVIQIQPEPTSGQETANMQRQESASTRRDTRGDHPNNFGTADNDRNQLVRGIASETLEHKEDILRTRRAAGSVANSELPTRQRDHESDLHVFPIFRHLDGRRIHPR